MTVAQVALILLSLLQWSSEAKRFLHYRPLRINEESDESGENHPRIWALLVAGSNGWYNYRHQADICHAYHILRNHGIPEEHIITMMYDDVAHNKENPYPGKLYNKPHGDEVYHGVKIDYRKADVTPQNFLAILQGNTSAVVGGNKRVIKSNAHDHIFVYFSDHGSTGMIAFPNDILSSEDLIVALKRMHRRRRFNQLAFYLEACESGSMFNGILPKDIGVYAITAANDHESSWGYYCDNDMNLPCMGDQFSINWMEDSDVEILSKELLQRQYEIVKTKTNLSHVMHYGDLSIAKEFVADFQGWKKGPTQRVSDYEEPPITAWPVRDIPLLMLDKQLRQEESATKRAEIRKKIGKLQRKREYLDNFMISLVEDIIHDPVNQRRILNVHPGAPTNLKCYDKVVKTFHRQCFHFSHNPYALKYAFVLANICNEGIEVDVILEKMLQRCYDIEITGIH